MRRHVIEQFLFPYQRSFAISFSIAAERVFQLIGAEFKPQTFLVGIAWPPIPGRHFLCIEPEDGPWPQSLFAATPESLEDDWKRHPMQQMFYGDEPTMRDKPENIRRIVVSNAIAKDLETLAATDGMCSFVSVARPVLGYYVAAILRVPQSLLVRFPAISYSWMNEQAEGSFLLSCIRQLLGEAERVLQMPEPGRFSHDSFRSAGEIVRRAAADLLRTPFLDGEFPMSDLFDDYNAISRLMYEGATGEGRMIIARRDNPNIDWVLKLARPAPLREKRWARKLLQMGSGATALVADLDSIHGLGRLRDASLDAFSVQFLDQQHWDFRRGNEIMLRTRFGEPRLPQEVIGEARFHENFRRLFPDAGEEAGQLYREILDLLLSQPRGSMLVVAEDAAAEANRLDRQGTRIEPTRLTADLIEKATRIDGTILADPQGLCHAIGVILDGSANDDCTPARGARYNSAVRYVTSPARRLAFVLSEDRTLDVIPLLRPRMSKKELEALVRNLEGASIDTYSAIRYQLDAARFYLTAAQCERVNTTLERLDKLALTDGQIVIGIALFAPDPQMTPEYLDP